MHCFNAYQEYKSFVVPSFRYDLTTSLLEYILMKISEFMTRDHKDCDLLFAKAEQVASKEKWDAAQQALADFVQAMERHFGVEEQELFPAFEEEIGMMTGPTEMMRLEHEQMRGLFVEMQDALEQNDSDDYLGVAETLLILMQQHNIKEEQILYTMIDALQLPDAGNWQQNFQRPNRP
jgi:hemerythrin-like domain-containing protein